MSLCGFQSVTNRRSWIWWLPGTEGALGNVIRLKIYALAGMEYPISHLGVFIVVFSFSWVIFHYCFMSILLFPCFSSQNLNWSWVILDALGFPAVCHTRDLLFCHSAECPVVSDSLFLDLVPSPSIPYHISKRKSSLLLYWKVSSSLYLSQDWFKICFLQERFSDKF